jgi:1-deoxy-D-xylulose-5-phosphate reductoisomerase
MKGIAIYGSTGSIGKQTLEIMAELNNFELVSLVCNGSIDVLEDQVRRYNPIFAGVVNEEKAEQLREKVKDTETTVVAGLENSIKICTGNQVDVVVNSTVGVSGLIPTIEFLKSGKDIALANKESLVVGGSLVRKIAAEKNVSIAPIWENGKQNGPGMYPIDSEHSAIWQCLQGEGSNKIEKIILTASGGPFRKSPIDALRTATPEDALKHPTWKMGGRITIDSSTLMNKGFEVMEAAWLFDVKPENVAVLIHPQSIIHSMVQFRDSSVKAQMGIPDMRLPIQYALSYPSRPENTLKRMDLAEIGHLGFEEPDMGKFKCLSLAIDAFRIGGTAPAVLNGADEMAVELFLNRKIKFLDIADSIEKALQSHKVVSNPNISDILTADKWARGFVSMHAAEKRSKSLSRG